MVIILDDAARAIVSKGYSIALWQKRFMAVKGKAKSTNGNYVVPVKSISEA